MPSQAIPHDVSRWETMAVVVVGSMATLAPALQPLLLGQLIVEARIKLVQIGQTAMMEGLGMAIAASVAGARLRPERLRHIAVGALIISMIVNLATGHLSGWALMRLQIIAGMCTGMLSWIGIGLLARHPVPARLCAIFILVHSSPLFLLSSAMSAVLFAAGGAQAGYALLVGTNVISLCAVSFIPRRYVSIKAGIELALPNRRELAGLAGLALFFAGIMALWVYVVPLGIHAGFAPAVGGVAISIGVAAQLLAGLCAGALAVRLSAPKVLVAGLLAATVVAAFIGSTRSEALFIGAVAYLAFLYVFAGAFQMPYLTLIDPSRRAAMQLSPAHFALPPPQGLRGSR